MHAYLSFCCFCHVVSHLFCVMSFDSVIRRLVTLISTQAMLTAEGEASKKQAESATAMAKKLLEEKENAANLVSF